MNLHQSLNDYKIKLQIFEGPLDLLLHLIKKDKIDIYDIPIAAITEQYLKYITVMHDLNIDLASDFLLMASYLIYLKSRILLNSGYDQEEEMDIEESKRVLAQRLIEYQTFKKGADVLSSYEMEHRKIIPSYGVQDNEPDEFIEADLLDLLKAYYTIIVKDKSDAPTYNIMADPEIIEKEIYRILSILRVKKSLFFRLLLDKHEKEHLVFIFLAVLELVKEQKIKIFQGHQFEEFLIHSCL